MSFDSSANLLFSIGAESSGAEAGLANFQSEFNGAMSSASADFFQWVEGILDGSATAEEALAGIGPALELGCLAATAAVASLGAALVELGQHQMEVSETIEQGARATGLSTEQLSGMDFAANQVGLSSEKLNTSLVRFANAVSAAQDPTAKQALAFKALGLSQDDVNAGQTDLYGLLRKTMDGFRDHADGANKDAIATALFRDRTGQLIQYLDMGSQGLDHFMERAEQTGNILRDHDAVAAKLASLAWADFRGELSGTAKEMGQVAIPVMGTMAIQLEGLKAAVKGFFTTPLELKDIVNPFAGLAKQWQHAVDAMDEEMTQAAMRIQRTMKDLAKPDNVPQLPSLHAVKTGGAGDDQTKQATEDYTAFSNILERVQTSLAGATSAEDKIAEETNALLLRVNEAAQKFMELNDAGKIAPAVFERETAAFGQLYDAINKLNEQQSADLIAKRNAAAIAATADLTKRLEAQQQDTYQHQVRLWNDEIAQLTAKLAKEGQLTAANQALIDQIQAAGLVARERKQSEAYGKELQALAAALKQESTVWQTEEQKLAELYQEDLKKYSAVEEAKAMLTASSTAEANVIATLYEKLRIAALQHYQQQLTTLQNSQGWQGIFGNMFAQGLKNNEQLLHDWSTSSNRDLLAVQVAWEDVQEQVKDTMQQMAQSMAQAAVEAFISAKSIGQAMEQAAKATIEALAEKSAVEAVFWLAEGFADLASYQYAQAQQAFMAAAIFGSVAMTAAVGARLMGPGSTATPAGGGSGSGSAPSSSDNSSSGSSGSGGSPGSNPGSCSVYVYGNIIGRQGIEELTDVINDAVQNRDVKLIASRVKTPGTTIR